MTGFWQLVISRINLRVPNIASVDRILQSIFLSYVTTVRTVLPEMVMQLFVLHRQKNAVGPHAGLQFGEHRTFTKDRFDVDWLTSVHQPQMLLEPLRDYVHVLTLRTKVCLVFALVVKKIMRPHFERRGLVALRTLRVAIATCSRKVL